jgi:hypothetical protein
MASYFVACDAQSDGAHEVHDRSRCPPACFPHEGINEYLGEFHNIVQAVTVARLRYRPARRCLHAEVAAPVRVKAPQALAAAFIPLRP